jgi:hypothetical protein
MIDELLNTFFPLDIKAQGETQIQTREADGLSLGYLL